MAPENPVSRHGLIPLGQVVNAHATRGELRVRLFNPASTTLTPGCTVVLRRSDEQQRRTVTALRRHKHYTLLTLERCDSMTAALELVGCDVCVPEADLPPAGPDEVYHYELIGMRVVTTAGAEIGAVIEVLSSPSNDVCVVRAGEREHLIPLIADVVRDVNRDSRCLVIEPLPGLLD